MGAPPSSTAKRGTAAYNKAYLSSTKKGMSEKQARSTASTVRTKTIGYDSGKSASKSHPMAAVKRVQSKIKARGSIGTSYR